MSRDARYSGGQGDRQELRGCTESTKGRDQSRGSSWAMIQREWTRRAGSTINKINNNHSTDTNLWVASSLLEDTAVRASLGTTTIKGTDRRIFTRGGAPDSVVDGIIAPAAKRSYTRTLLTRDENKRQWRVTDGPMAKVVPCSCVQPKDMASTLRRNWYHQHVESTRWRLQKSDDVFPIREDTRHEDLLQYILFHCYQKKFTFCN